MLLFGMEKVTKYTLELPVTTSTFQWIMNWKTYNAMSAAQKKVIDDHCTTDWASKFAGPWIDFEAGGLTKVKAMPNREIYPITDDADGGMEKVGRACLQAMGRRCAQGRRRSGHDHEGVAGGAGAEQGRLLNRYSGVTSHTGGVDSQ